MTFLYTIGILLFRLGVQLAVPFSPKAAQWVRGRRRLFAQLRQALSARGSRPLAWVHCASLGEFEQGRPVIEAIRAQHPEYFVLVTFFSPSGYEVRKGYRGADHVCYLPADLPRSARRFVRMVQPTVAIFVKYELWYHHLRALRSVGARVYLISAIFSREQAFFNRALGAFFVRMLHMCEHIFVQTKGSLPLLAELGVHHASYAGDTRFDRVLAVAASAHALPQLADFAQGQTVIVAGSTWAPDERLLADLVNHTPGLKLIVAPHEVSEGGVRHTLALMHKPAITHSAWQQSPGAGLAGYSVFVVDAVGFLSSLYRFGTIAYVGGGFGVGIHNTLEAAVYGIPVIFGTNYRSFAEAVDLVALGGAYSVGSLPELQHAVGALRSNHALRERSGDACRRYVQQHGGATEVVMKKIFG